MDSVFVFIICFSLLQFHRTAETKKKFTFQEKVDIVKKHNEYRSQIKAADMEKMSWDYELEKVAQKWASNCKFEHNSNRNSEQKTYTYVGENLYYTTGSVSGSEFVKSWYDEVNDYTYSDNSCNEGKQCGHFTQVVWHDTTAVGCGISFCEADPDSGDDPFTLVVCDYGPAGNFVGHKPYKEGQPCSECPEKKPVCENDLCSAKACAEMKCRNGGKLNIETCMCDCTSTKFKGNICQSPVSGGNRISGHALQALIFVAFFIARY